MTGMLFLAAIVAALVAVGMKKLRMGPRVVEDSAPRLITSHREIDDALPRRCACGGHFDKTGEGPTRSGGAECIRVLMVCDKCERRRILLFTLAS